MKLNLENSLLRHAVHLELCMSLTKQIMKYISELFSDSDPALLYNFTVTMRMISFNLVYLRTHPCFVDRIYTPFQIIGYSVKLRSTIVGTHNSVKRIFNDELLENIPVMHLITELITVIQNTITKYKADLLGPSSLAVAEAVQESLLNDSRKLLMYTKQIIDQSGRYTLHENELPKPSVIALAVMYSNRVTN